MVCRTLLVPVICVLLQGQDDVILCINEFGSGLSPPVQPYVPTGTALSFVNTYNLTALTASPSLVLFFYELLNATFANVGKIPDHAHSIPGLIAGV